MASWDDVRRIANALPETSERSGNAVQWRVEGKPVGWERPMRQGEPGGVGARAPADTPLAGPVPDLGAREALLAEAPDIHFATSHFDGYPIVLVHLDRIGRTELEELLTEAWLSRAPKRVANAYLAGPD